MSFKLILVPVDGSDGAAHAARFAAGLASLTGARLLLANVVHLTSSETLGLAHLDRDEIQRRIASHATPNFESARAAMGELAGKVEIEDIMVLGDPALEILGLVRNRSADLVVMGSRGLSPFQGYLLGSVSEKIARHADCPVTIVR
jgi:nucleotide-binding universal stress UspA family protein